MEEVVEYLQSTAKDVDGISMVTLTAALQAIQAASSVNLLASLEQTTAGLFETLSQEPDTFEIEE